MKVLMIRCGCGVSGAEVYNYNLIKGFRKYSDVDILYITNNKSFSEKIKSSGVESFLINPLADEIGTKRNFLKALVYSPFFVLNYLVKIKNVEKGNKFDLICLQSMTEKIFLTPVLKLLLYKVAWIEHGPLFKTNRAELIKIFYKFISIFVDRIISVSKNTEKDLINGGVNKNKITTLYIGVDIDLLKPLTDEIIKKDRKKIGINSEKVIGFMGSICIEKGIKEFVEVAKKINEENKRIKFLIIGDGPMLKWSKEEVEKCGFKDNFIFTGYVENVKDYLGIIDILFFPTKHNEGLSLTLLESLSMGKVVVASDMGGNIELIKNNKNGFIFKYSDFNNISDFLVSLSNSEKLRNEIGKTGREFVIENFNIKINSQKFYNTFTNI